MRNCRMKQTSPRFPSSKEPYISTTYALHDPIGMQLVLANVLWPLDKCVLWPSVEWIHTWMYVCINTYIDVCMYLCIHTSAPSTTALQHESIDTSSAENVAWTVYQRGHEGLQSWNPSFGGCLVVFSINCLFFYFPLSFESDLSCFFCGLGGSGSSSSSSSSSSWERHKCDTQSDARTHTHTHTHTHTNTHTHTHTHTHVHPHARTWHAHAYTPIMHTYIFQTAKRGTHTHTLFNIHMSVFQTQKCATHTLNIHLGIFEQCRKVYSTPGIAHFGGWEKSTKLEKPLRVGPLRANATRRISPV